MASSSSWFAKIGNLILLRDRVRTARAQVQTLGDVRARAANQARLLIEIARRVAEPVEALPVGAIFAVEVGLYADAAHWALVALGSTPVDETGSGRELGSLWASVPADLLLRGAGGDAQVLATVQRLLGTRPVGGNLSASESDASAARRFAEALVWELDAPERRIEHLLVQRWLRVGLAVVVLGVIGVGARALLTGPNLIADRPFTLSTTYTDCAHKGMCGELMFHTLTQDNPWAEWDLGSIKPVHRVEITNRSDCCGERVAGLVVELSTDHKTWTEVAHNETVFAKWTPSFPKRPTRFVRLRIARPASTLHLDDVIIR